MSQQQTIPTHVTAEDLRRVGVSPAYAAEIAGLFPEGRVPLTMTSYDAVRAAAELDLAPFLEELFPAEVALPDEGDDQDDRAYCAALIGALDAARGAPVAAPAELVGEEVEVQDA